MAGAYPSVKVGGLNVCHRVNTDRQTPFTRIFTPANYFTQGIFDPGIFADLQTISNETLTKISFVTISQPISKSNESNRN